jgi:hypothetical protein
MAFRLSPQSGEILRMLYDNEIVKSPELRQYAPGYKVSIYHLRNMLRLYKIDIQSQQRLGYWISREGKERIKQVLDGNLPGQGETAEKTIPPVSQSNTASEVPVAGS